jgi:hypothetical protein
LYSEEGKSKKAKGGDARLRIHSTEPQMHRRHREELKRN